MSDGEPLDLTADERKALVALLRQTLEYARFPLAPRLDPAEGDLGEIGTAKASISTAAGGCWADPRQQAPAVTDEYRRRHSCAATSRCRRRGGSTRPVPCTCTPKRSCLTDRSNRPGSRSCRCENEIPHGWKPRDRSYKLRALPRLGGSRSLASLLRYASPPKLTLAMCLEEKAKTLLICTGIAAL